MDGTFVTDVVTVVTGARSEGAADGTFVTDVVTVVTGARTVGTEDGTFATNVVTVVAGARTRSRVDVIVVRGTGIAGARPPGRTDAGSADVAAFATADVAVVSAGPRVADDRGTTVSRSTTGAGDVGAVVRTEPTEVPDVVVADRVVPDAVVPDVVVAARVVLDVVVAARVVLDVVVADRVVPDVVVLDDVVDDLTEVACPAD
ncbi:hypothetical protein [Actinomycetospora chiangmaiensis]|uniref:hypothetical protein n=1 Tax=Actinomycetospora chiangmaiensis TaxID=402650 RepID=UPI000368D407|nr:hypothetical protein [Actinomycetospora chiangmaiensis]